MLSMRNRHTVPMSLTQWSAFVEVCRTGSFRAAAETTGFSQPGLSRQVAALERSLGVKLLDRGPRGVVPTTAGAALLPHARLVVSEARRGREAAQSAHDRPAHLVLGGVPSTTASLVPRAVGDLRRMGGPECFVVTALTPRLLLMVIGREVDAALVTDAAPGLPRDAELRATHLHDDEMVVIAPKGYPHASTGRLDARDLSEETWIEDNPGSEIMLRQLAAKAGFEPRIVTLADDLLAKTGMVAAGLGIALVPGVMLPALRADLAVLRLKRPAERGLYLLTRKDRPRQDALVAALAE